MTKYLSLLIAVVFLASAVHSQESTVDKAASAKESAKQADAAEAIEKEEPEKVDWTKVDWRKRLTRLQYHIMREAGTERKFKNQFWDFFKPGEYRCAGCGLPLFESNAKFDSECGWPSFDQTIAKDTVTEHEDLKMFQPRVEIRCRRCEAHLGHVFNDGPTKTGLRYCMNSAAMKFVTVKDLKKDGDAAAKRDKAEAKADSPKADPK